jgi:energy-coupling factor transporter ATP-binding protein EcfA2
MPVAELQNVTKKYGAATALDGIELTIERGELLAVLGPNGAGKTTAVCILLGLTEQTSGRAAIFGHAPASHAAKLRRGAMLQVARVPETIHVREHIELFSSYYPTPLKFEHTIAAAGLGGVEKRLFGTSPRVRNSACCSRWPSAATLTCCSWTSLLWGWMWKRGAACGNIYVDLCRAAAACCSPRITWTRQTRWRTGSP